MCYKTEIERNNITILFNNLLEVYCKEYNIILKSISLHLMNEDKTSIKNFYAIDNIHLNTNAKKLLEDKFSNLIINDSE